MRMQDVGLVISGPLLVAADREFAGERPEIRTRGGPPRTCSEIAVTGCPGSPKAVFSPKFVLALPMVLRLTGGHVKRAASETRRRRVANKRASRNTRWFVLIPRLTNPA